MKGGGIGGVLEGGPYAEHKLNIILHSSTKEAAHLATSFTAAKAKEEN